MRQPFRIVLSLLLIGTVVAASAHAGEFIFHHEEVMGTSFELRVRADEARAAVQVESRILDEIARLSGILSRYDSGSEFSRWQAKAGEPATISPELAAILHASEQWQVRSEGAFDPRVGAFSELWTKAARAQRLPTLTEIADTSDQIRRPAWSLDADACAATRLATCPLSFDGIAKGYILEQACAVAMMRGAGIQGILLNVGGDLRAVGESPWTIGLSTPRGDSDSTEALATVQVMNRSVATSGDAFRGFQIGATWYSHIIDPRAGWPARQVQSATVIAPAGVDADALATICNILTVQKSLALIDSIPDVECILHTADGREWSSDGWKSYVVEEPSPDLLSAAREPAIEALAAAVAPAATTVPASAASWGDAFEMVVDFSINRPEASGTGPYRRPYVVIWAEDAEGRTVRTLSLWVSLGGSGPIQWLPDLRRWYRAEPGRSLGFKKNFVYTIARPTRPPGQYRVVWDGKDDSGAPLPPGPYTLFIETAREHGTNQLIRKQVVLDATPFSEELPGNVEIKSAALEYRRKDAGR